MEGSGLGGPAEPGGAVQGTVPPQVTRLLIQAGVAAGLDRSQLATVPGLSVLDQGGIRIPTATLLRVWELLAGPAAQPGGGTVMEWWRPGALGVWDYLFFTSATLEEAFHTAGIHFSAIADPADELRVVRGDEGLTVSWRGLYHDHPQYPLIAQFVPQVLLTVASAAAERRLVPVRVGLPEARRVTGEGAITLYRTARVDLGVEHPSITFAEADLDGPLPRADPALASILAEHARLSTASARLIRGWLDRFHSALESTLADGIPTLDQVAWKLAMSPRTVQRRLRDEGTNWREEVEQVRRRRVDALLRDSRLSMDAIADRVGFADARSLRRAVHRWYGQGPAAVRAREPR